MSVLIDPKISIKRNLLKLIQSTNPNFNFATVSHFVIVGGGVLTPTETVTIDGKSIELDTWVKIQGVTIWGVEGEHTFKYKRADLSVLKNYSEIFACWDYDAALWDTFLTDLVTLVSGKIVSTDTGLDNLIRTSSAFDWMGANRNPITINKVLDKYYLHNTENKIGGSPAIIGTFYKTAWNLKPSLLPSVDVLNQGTGAGGVVLIDTVNYYFYSDKPTKYLASFLNIHPAALLDERPLAYSTSSTNSNLRPACLAVKIGEDDVWFRNSVETTKFLYKSTLMVYSNYSDGPANASVFNSKVTQTTIDALRQ